MTPGDGFVVGGPGAEATVKVSRRSGSQGAQCPAVQVGGGALCIVQTRANPARARRAQRPLVGRVSPPVPHPRSSDECHGPARPRAPARAALVAAAMVVPPNSGREHPASQVATAAAPEPDDIRSLLRERGTGQPVDVRQEQDHPDEPQRQNSDRSVVSWRRDRSAGTPGTATAGERVAHPRSLTHCQRERALTMTTTPSSMGSGPSRRRWMSRVWKRCSGYPRHFVTSSGSGSNSPAATASRTGLQ